MAEEITPPGEYVRAELEARGWTQTDLAEILGVGFQTVNEIILGKRRITPDNALRLAAAFGNNADYWLGLDQAYQLWQSRKTDTDLVSRRARLYQYAPVKEMARRGWLPECESLDRLEESVSRFFGVNSLDEEPEPLKVAARKSTSYNVAFTSAQRAWLMRAKNLAQVVHAEKFSRSNEQATVERLRLLTHEPKEARHVPRILSDAGIRYVVVEPLSGVKIDGACLWLDDGPVIAMSLRYDRIDNFWFCLLHEVHHAYHQVTSVDSELDQSQRQSERPIYEQQADEFSARTLVEPAALESFIVRKRPLYSTTVIEAFARTRGVHPGIVVGLLQGRGELQWANLRKLLVPIRNVVTGSALTDGWGSVVPALD